MYLFKNFFWKSERNVSLIKALFCGAGQRGALSALSIAPGKQSLAKVAGAFCRWWKIGGSRDNSYLLVFLLPRAIFEHHVIIPPVSAAAGAT